MARERMVIAKRGIEGKYTIAISETTDSFLFKFAECYYMVLYEFRWFFAFCYEEFDYQ